MSDVEVTGDIDFDRRALAAQPGADGAPRRPARAAALDARLALADATACSLDRNELAAIPPGVLNLSRLKVLSLRHNRVGPGVTESIGRLSALTSVSSDS